MKLHKISANETELHYGNNVIFFSYDTPVAFFQSGVGYFRTEHTFSKTTSKHITRWLRGFKAEVVPQATVEAFLG
jgi:hypothetical protein